jgi:hypothetical protein
MLYYAIQSLVATATDLVLSLGECSLEEKLLLREKKEKSLIKDRTGSNKGKSLIQDAGICKVAQYIHASNSV